MTELRQERNFVLSRKADARSDGRASREFRQTLSVREHASPASVVEISEPEYGPWVQHGCLRGSIVQLDLKHQMITG